MVGKSGRLWPQAGGQRRGARGHHVSCSSTPPPSGVASRCGASGQGPAESVFKPGYFEKDRSELTKGGEADEVK